MHSQPDQRVRFGATQILALLNVVAYGIFAFKGNLNTICDGASELAEKAAMAEMVNCGAGWMKYAIWAVSLLIHVFGRIRGD